MRSPLVKLQVLPQQAEIDRLAGVVDFYAYKGQPCARKWPHWPKRVAYAREKANQDRFGYAIHAWNTLPEYIKQMYRNMAAGTSLTARDLFMRSYINGNPF